MNITADMTGNYKILPRSPGQKTKPIQSQFKPNLTQFKANLTQLKPKQTQFKPNFNGLDNNLYCLYIEISEFDAEKC